MANIGGWGVYLFLAGLVVQGEEKLTVERLYALLTAFPLGVLLSHGLRFFYVHFTWTERSVKWLLPRVFLLSVLTGSLFFILHSALNSIWSGPRVVWELTLFDLFQSVLNWSLLFLFWSILYFAYHSFRMKRKKELEALQWRASKSELELKQLRDQLNPHFIFNCLNSIRALIDEEPEKARKAVNKLSNTLRNTLRLSRKGTISLEEELKVVEDYLSLERIRLEERLSSEIELPSEAFQQRIPPLLLQNLVENGVKHGISRIPEGGRLEVKGWQENGTLFIRVSNPKADQGTSNDRDSSGTGMENTRKRLQLLFGDRAVFRTEERDGRFHSFIELPLEHELEDDHRR